MTFFGIFASLPAMVAKIIGYESSSPSEEVLLVADANETYDFEGANAQLRRLIPSSLRVNEIDRGRLDAAAARSQLVETINRGQKLVNYAGHGSVDSWRGGLLTNAGARLFESKTHPSLFIMMTCLNGYSHDPALDSLAKALLKAEQGGAAAVWASSGMTEPSQQGEMNRQLYRLMFGATGQSLTVGELVARAKAQISDPDIRRTWTLLGDPAMRIR